MFAISHIEEFIQQNLKSRKLGFFSPSLKYAEFMRRVDMAKSNKNKNRKIAIAGPEPNMLNKNNIRQIDNTNNPTLLKWGGKTLEIKPSIFSRQVSAPLYIV